MTKWLRAKQNVESWLIIPNIISFFERDILEFTTREAQSRNSFQNEMACVHSVKRCAMVWSIGQKGQHGESSFFILNNKLLVHRILWIILYWNIDSFTSLVVTLSLMLHAAETQSPKPRDSQTHKPRDPELHQTLSQINLASPMNPEPNQVFEVVCAISVIGILRRSPGLALAVVGSGHKNGFWILHYN